MATDARFDYINEPTLADAIMDRLHAAGACIELTGESMRKSKKTTKILFHQYICKTC
jgi:DNA replication protein DnaC